LIDRARSGHFHRKGAMTDQKGAGRNGAITIWHAKSYFQLLRRE